MEHVCKICGVVFYNSHRTRKTCSVPCAAKWRSGSGSPNFKGGSFDKNGYRVVRRGRDLPAIREHRLVMERMIGRPLLKTEVVHHKNGNILDNRPENLELFKSQGDHRRHHAKYFRSATHKQCARCRAVKSRVLFPPTSRTRPTEDPNGSYCNRCKSVLEAARIKRNRLTKKASFQPLLPQESNP